MSQAHHTPAGGDTEMWTLLRQHHSDIGVLQSTVDGLGKSVGALGGKVDEILSVVTRHTAKQGPSLFHYLGGVLVIISIIAGLATGVGVYVSSTWGPLITNIANDASWSKSELQRRNAEDREELQDYRDEHRDELAKRLRALEDNQGWRPSVHASE